MVLYLIFFEFIYTCRLWCQYWYLDMLCCNHHGCFCAPIFSSSTTSNAQFKFWKTLSGLDCSYCLRCTSDFLLPISGSFLLPIFYGRRGLGYDCMLAVHPLHPCLVEKDSASLCVLESAKILNFCANFTLELSDDAKKLNCHPCHECI